MRQILSRKNFQHFLKMVAVGSTGMVLQFLIYNVLRMYLSPLWATQIAVTIAIINNFYWHGRVTFAQENFGISQLWNREGMLFIGFSLLMILLQGQWLTWTVALFKAGPLMENALVFAGMIWGSVLNFIVYRYIIWR